MPGRPESRDSVVKYKIGELAQLLNISIETVRNYEALGIVQPERDDTNNYRLYNAVDFNLIRRARSYSSMGFPMKDAAELILHSDVERLSDSIGRAQTQIEARIAYENMLLRYLRDKQQHLNRIVGMEGQCAIENSPAMYGIVYRKGQNLIKEQKIQALVHQWNEYRPFTEAMLNYSIAYIQNIPGHSFQHGFCMEARYASYFGIEESSSVMYYPPCKCLYVYGTNPFEPDSPGADHKHQFVSLVRKCLEERTLSPTGQPRGRVIHTSKASGSYLHYIEMWIPI